MKLKLMFRHAIEVWSPPKLCSTPHCKQLMFELEFAFNFWLISYLSFNLNDHIIKQKCHAKLRKLGKGLILFSGVLPGIAEQRTHKRQHQWLVQVTFSVEKHWYIFEIPNCFCWLQCKMILKLKKKGRVELYGN